jgi:uroporphyrinogen decarboxylase
VTEIYEGFLEKGLTFDAAALADDLGYQASPLISPELYREVVMPHHKMLCDYFADRGLATMFHSDGNIAPLIPSFLEAGFRSLNPLEVKAGLDLRPLKKQYGDRLVLYGNIDVRKLSGSLEMIEEEILPKLQAVGDSGGYIFHSDHSVPNNVSLKNYRHALSLVRDYASG